MSIPTIKLNDKWYQCLNVMSQLQIAFTLLYYVESFEGEKFHFFMKIVKLYYKILLLKRE